MSATPDVACSRAACGKVVPELDAVFYNGLPYCRKSCHNLESAGAATAPRYSVPLQEKTP